MIQSKEKRHSLEALVRIYNTLFEPVLRELYSSECRWQVDFFLSVFCNYSILIIFCHLWLTNGSHYIVSQCTFARVL